MSAGSTPASGQAGSGAGPFAVGAWSGEYRAYDRDFTPTIDANKARQAAGPERAKRPHIDRTSPTGTVGLPGL